MIAFLTPLLLAFFAGDATGVTLDGALGKDYKVDKRKGISRPFGLVLVTEVEDVSR